MALIKEIKKKKIFTFNVNTGVHDCYDYEKSLPALNKLLERKEVFCEFGRPLKKETDTDEDYRFRLMHIYLENICGKLFNFVIEDSVGLDDEVSKCLFADFAVCGPFGEHCFDEELHKFGYRLIEGDDFVRAFITWDVMSNV